MDVFADSHKHIERWRVVVVKRKFNCLATNVAELVQFIFFLTAEVVSKNDIKMKTCNMKMWR